jgi:hypothetical protein
MRGLTAKYQELAAKENIETSLHAYTNDQWMQEDWEAYTVE